MNRILPHAEIRNFHVVIFGDKLLYMLIQENITQVQLYFAQCCNGAPKVSKKCYNATGI